MALLHHGDIVSEIDCLILTEIAVYWRDLTLPNSVGLIYGRKTCGTHAEDTAQQVRQIGEKYRDNGGPVTLVQYRKHRNIPRFPGALYRFLNSLLINPKHFKSWY
jgi:hypothetical protein